MLVEILHTILFQDSFTAHKKQWPKLINGTIRIKPPDVVKEPATVEAPCGGPHVPRSGDFG